MYLKAKLLLTLFVILNYNYKFTEQLCSNQNLKPYKKFYYLYRQKKSISKRKQLTSDNINCELLHLSKKKKHFDTN